MIQSITFRDKNTWDDWRLLPTERPVFTPPKQKTTYIDIPGGNGSLDLSESLTGYPVYNNRTGSFKFRVMNGFMLWQDRYSQILEHLHGKAMRAVLADDPDWFYQGRFSVDSWTSGNTWSEITISYSVNPYKWTVLSSIDPWLWDPFNFEKDIIWEQAFADIAINSPSSWTSNTFDGVFFGTAPISPVFHVTNSSMLDVRFQNEFLGIDRTIRLENGENVALDFIFYGQSSYTLLFKGIGTVSIEFRVGRL